MFLLHSHFLHNCCLNSLPEAFRGYFCTHFGSILGAYIFFTPFFEYVFLYQFWCISGRGTPQGRCWRRGRSTCGLVGILHFGVWMVIFLCVFQHSGKVAVKHPRDSHLSDLSQVTLQVPLGSCTCNFTRGGSRTGCGPARRRWREGSFAPRRI